MGIVAIAPSIPQGRDWYITALVLAAAPFATAGLAFTWRALHQGPAGYRSFWRRWFAAAVTAYAAGTAALAAVLTDAAAFWAAAALLLVAAVPLWAAASVRMLQTQSGRRAVSVDLLDGATALVVLGAPAILAFGESLTSADHPLFALPFVASVALMPGGLYLSVLGLGRVPRGRRTSQAIGTALGASFALNASVQIVQVVNDFTLPSVLVVGAQVLNMGLLMAVPLWAQREPASVLDTLLPEEQVRHTDPLAVISVALLPVLALVAWAGRAERPWGVGFVLGVLLAVVVLGAVRNALLRRETRQLYHELELVADERRALVSGMVRSLEDDRRRMAAELHVQAVESFASLGALVQSAYLTLPPDAAVVVKQTIAHLQDDLHARADALRQLTAALQPPAFEFRDADTSGADGVVHEGALATALRAVASELIDARSPTVVTIEVDPALELDWSTTTMAYRIAQEALTNSASHSLATRITVEVRAEDQIAVVEVTDDGIGFDPAAARAGTGIASMALLTELSDGALEIDSSPGRGTRVRASLGRLGRQEKGAEVDPGPRRRLLLVDGGQEELRAASVRPDPVR